MKLQDTTVVFLVSDIAATMRWYRENLGFDGRAVPERPPHNFAIIRRDDVEIMLQQMSGYVKPDLYKKREGGVWNVYVQVHGVSEFYEQVSAQRDVTIIEKLRKQPYGQIEFVVQDPNGYTLVFAEAA